MLIVMAAWLGILPFLRDTNKLAVIKSELCTQRLAGMFRFLCTAARDNAVSHSVTGPRRYPPYTHTHTLKRHNYEKKSDFYSCICISLRDSKYRVFSNQCIAAE